MKNDSRNDGSGSLGWKIEIATSRRASLSGRLHAFLYFNEKDAREQHSLIKKAIEGYEARDNDLPSMITIRDDAGEGCFVIADLESVRLLSEDVWFEFARLRHQATAGWKEVEDDEKRFQE